MGRRQEGMVREVAAPTSNESIEKKRGKLTYEKKTSKMSTGNRAHS